MRKLVSLIILAVLPLSLFAAEPAVIMSLMAPSVIYGMTGSGGVYEADDLGREGALLLTIPAETAASGLSLSDMLSCSLHGTLKAIADLSFLVAGYDDFSVIGASGSVAVEPQFDAAAGTASLSISYDDVSVLYRFGSRMDEAAIDGDVRFTASLFTDPLLSAVISADDIVINGDGSFSDSDVELRLYLNEGLISSYLEYTGQDIDALRQEAAEAFLTSPVSAFIGYPESAENVLAFAADHNAMDLVDAAAFVLASSSNSTLSEADILSMMIVPAIYIDGKEAEDLDMQKAMRWYSDIMNLASMLE